MTKLSYQVGNKNFTSAQYEEAKAEAARQGVLITPVYEEINTMPKADSARIAKLKEARQRKEIERIMAAVGV